MILFYLFFILFGNVYSYKTNIVNSLPVNALSCNTEQCLGGTYCYSVTNECTKCPAGYIYKNDPNIGISSIELWGCNICPANTFSINSGSKSCTPCTQCSPGSYVSKKCSLVYDTQCNTCDEGYYYDTDGCYQCSPCLDDYYISANCTSTDNTMCSGCTVCDDNSYETSPCTMTTDRVCNKCIISCNKGEMLIGDCSSTSKPECISNTPFTIALVLSQFLEMVFLYIYNFMLYVVGLSDFAHLVILSSLITFCLLKMLINMIGSLIRR